MAFPAATICNDEAVAQPIPVQPPQQPRGFPTPAICPDPQSEQFRGKVAPIFPVIPQAVDLPSLIAGMNIIRMILQQNFAPNNFGTLPGRFPIILNNKANGQLALRNNARDTNQPNQHGRLIEVARKTERVRITSKDDENVWVDILRINALTLQDAKTGELWVWNR